jgi:hypothetical protein
MRRNDRGIGIEIEEPPKPCYDRGNRRHTRNMNRHIESMVLRRRCDFEVSARTVDLECARIAMCVGDLDAQTCARLKKLR